MTNVPEIRFKGFSEPWKQRKLCEVCDMGTGYTPSKSNPAFWENGTIPWIRLEDIRKNGRILSDALQHVTPEAVKGKLIPAYSIIISTTATIGEHALIIVDSLANQQFTFITINVNCLKDLNPYFVFFVCYKLSDWCKTNTNSGGLLAVDMEGFKNWKFSFPCMEEQDKIAKLMMELYNSIEHHKQKLDGLKKLKKGYLQQMFPQNGETVPKMRLKGFTEPWEQRRLGDIVERITRKNTNLESTLPLTISAQFGLVDQNDFFNKQVASKDVSGYFLVKNGEFAYNKSYSNGYPWGAIKRLDKYEMGVLSTLYIVFKPLDVESEFLAQYYESNCWHTEVSQYCTEGARNHGLLNIAVGDFFETKIKIPRDKEEQIAIGNFFRNLDNQITTQSQKVEQLQQLQAAYLQKMFV